MLATVRTSARLGANSRHIFLSSAVLLGVGANTVQGNGRTQSDALLPTSSSSLVMPTLQALQRASRLIKTAFMMAVDYKMDKFGLSRVEMDDENRDEREKLEQLVLKQHEQLKQAQETYATKSHAHLTLEERLEAKKHEKERMQYAAAELATTEEKLRRIGNRRDFIHRKAAQRLLDLCRLNGGVYIKVGQHLANLDYLIPEAYIDTLHSLFDDTPRSSYEDVREVFKQDIGKYPEQIFDSFEKEPIASASLAQVHVAYYQGRKLAVKVQHRGLRETSVGDLFALVSVVRLAERLFQDFSYGWLADEIAPHLPYELDFRREGSNAERAAENIAPTGLACVIPKIIWNWTTPRVLTMEFEEGFKATDMKRLEDVGLDKRDVAQLISSVFASQVFLSGWVHCDPHPANVLMRRGKSGKPEMVLVDHGLYRELDNEFRMQYSNLWKNLMLADLKGIKAACKDLGVDNMYELFSAMLTARPFDEIIERSKKGSLRHHDARPESKADQVVIRGYAQKYLTQIFDLLDSIPRQMLLLLKMNDCLRHIDYKLGTPANTLIVSGHYATKALYRQDIRSAKSFLERVRVWFNFFQVSLRINVHDWILLWVTSWRI